MLVRLLAIGKKDARWPKRAEFEGKLYNFLPSPHRPVEIPTKTTDFISCSLDGMYCCAVKVRPATKAEVSTYEAAFKI